MKQPSTSASEISSRALRTGGSSRAPALRSHINSKPSTAPGQVRVQTNAGNDAMVLKPARLYNWIARSLDTVTIRLTASHPASRKPSRARRSNSDPMPKPRQSGATQSCVMCPTLAPTVFPRQIPRNLGDDSWWATRLASGKKRPLISSSQNRLSAQDIGIIAIGFTGHGALVRSEPGHSESPAATRGPSARAWNRWAGRSWRSSGAGSRRSPAAGGRRRAL